VFAIGGATAIVTLAGGTLALRFQSRIALLLGFAAGAVVGVALFDLLPEALSLAARADSPLQIAGVAGAGFAGYLAVDRALSAAAGAARGHLGPASLTLHSLLDGLAIGFSFQASPAIGLVVAVAVLAHDLADGVNTVTLSLAGGGGTRRARGWLIADALAPLLGVAATRLIAIAPATLGLLMALFAGFFLYIGASELTPSSRRAGRGAGASLATVAGMALIYAVVRLAGG
jgi:ZIP family zinc transporter